jgi:hypothetical protein
MPTLDKTELLNRDLAMMQSPSDWPRWPLLPLVRRTGSWSDPDNTAFQVADGRPVIYFGNILMLPKAEKGMTMADWLKAFKQREFTSFEELAAEYCVD